MQMHVAVFVQAQVHLWTAPLHPTDVHAPYPAHLPLKLLVWSNQVKNGTLYVNGNARVEPFINEKPAYVLNRLVVPPGDVSAAAALGRGLAPARARLAGRGIYYAHTQRPAAFASDG
jgi:hypothetical protein